MNQKAAETQAPNGPLTWIWYLVVFAIMVTLGANMAAAVLGSGAFQALVGTVVGFFVAGGIVWLWRRTPSFFARLALGVLFLVVAAISALAAQALLESRDDYTATSAPTATAQVDWSQYRPADLPEGLSYTNPNTPEPALPSLSEIQNNIDAKCFSSATSGKDAVNPDLASKVCSCYAGKVAGHYSAKEIMAMEKGVIPAGLGQMMESCTAAFLDTTTQQAQPVAPVEQPSQLTPDQQRAQVSWNDKINAWAIAKSDFLQDPARKAAMTKALEEVEASNGGRFTDDELISSAEAIAFRRTGWRE